MVRHVQLVIVIGQWWNTIQAVISNLELPSRLLHELYNTRSNYKLIVSITNVRIKNGFLWSGNVCFHKFFTLFISFENYRKQLEESHESARN